MTPDHSTPSNVRRAQPRQHRSTMDTPQLTRRYGAAASIRFPTALHPPQFCVRYVHGINAVCIGLIKLPTHIALPYLLACRLHNETGTSARTSLAPINSLSAASERVIGHNQYPNQWVTSDLPSRIKRSKHEALRSPMSKCIIRGANLHTTIGLQLKNTGNISA